MSNYIAQVDCINLDITKSIINIAKKNGWVDRYDMASTPYRIIVFTSSGYLTGDSREVTKSFGKILSIEEAIEFASKPPKELIKIGEYEVCFVAEGIKVGCKTVSKETIKKIYDRVFNGESK